MAAVVPLQRIRATAVLVAYVVSVSTVLAGVQGDEYLTWTATQAREIGKRMRASARAGSRLHFRGLHTERAANYKIRATWLTPEVIRATARLEQLKQALSNEQTRALVSEADVSQYTVFLVEIDPTEGSGIVPEGWSAILRPAGLASAAPVGTAGRISPSLRDVKALSGVEGRDYDYDRFWVVFTLIDKDRHPLFSESATEIQLLVRIRDMEARLSWKIPESIHKRLSSSAEKE